MNEITLNALINLFAIFSVQTKSGKTDAQIAFSSYLKQQLGMASSNEYKSLFDELIDLYGIDGEPQIPVDMNLQAKRIATNLKSRLHHTEQIMVFLRFLELSRSGDIEKGDNLIQILAHTFAISKEDTEKYKQFIFYSSDETLDSFGFLIINSNTKSNNTKIKHLQCKSFDGELLFLFLEYVGHYIFNFRGKENIFLEGNPVLPNKFYAFREGGILKGPRIEPIYFAEVVSGFFDQSHAVPFVLRAEGIDFRFKNSSNGLYDFSFNERSGQLVAIMGGSGVGKSTLLNILNGTIPVDKGHIYINDLDIHIHKKEIEGLIGFVPQDDLLFEDLTVWQNMYYNARLCFDEFTEDQINSRVANVLKELELTEYKDLKVGSPLKKTISGGQRKRLNVALELIREPSILYVDEPTSGLSSMDSEKVMLLLKEQARKGKIILVNIHQPSSTIFKLFDKLWIMDKGGRPIYTGNPLDGIIYFKSAIGHVNATECECLQCGHVNPEQVLEIVETKKIDESGYLMAERYFSPNDWYELYKEKIERKQTDINLRDTENPKSEFHKPKQLKQFFIFLQRNFRIKVTDKQYMLINLIEAPILAAIVAYFTRFAQDNQYILLENKNLISYLFMSIVVVLFMGMSVSAEEIIKDRKILQRESFLNLSRFSYLNSKIVFLLFLSAFQTLTFVMVGNFILGIQGMNLAFWMVLFSVAVFSNILGLNISSAFDSVVTIYILIPLLLIPQILLCGVIVKFDDLQDKKANNDVVPIVGELMVSRWAFEALAVKQFTENSYMEHFFDIERKLARSRYMSDLLITELIGRVDQIMGFINTNKPEDEIIHKLNIIQNEIRKLHERGQFPAFSGIDDLVFISFTPAVADSAKLYLQQQKDYLINHNNELRNKKDKIVHSLIQGKEKNNLFMLKQNNHNKALEDMVMNKLTQEYFRETDDGIMQKVAPIYKKSDFNNGRSHFFSAEKVVAGIYINTFIFNLSIIWLMSFVLYLALYFDWLRKAMEGIGNIKLNK
jgi:ABC-type multidrug transport system ATPase subunit